MRSGKADRSQSAREHASLETQGDAIADLSDVGDATASSLPHLRSSNGGRWVIDRDATEHRPADLARVVVGLLGATVAGLWSQAGGSVDTNLTRVVNGLPNSLESVARALSGLGSLWTVGAVGLLLLLTRRPRPTIEVVLAGGGAWAIARVLNDLVGTRSVNGLAITVRAGSGPTYPSVRVAVVTAVVVVLAPRVVRPLRRLSSVIVIAVALAALFQGTALVSDAVGGWFVGVAVGAAILVAFGAPGGRPSTAEVACALNEMGLDVRDIQDASIVIPRATVMDVLLTSGGRLRVDAFGRDQRDSEFAAKVWRDAMYHEPGASRFGSRLQQVEHIAYATLLAERAGARVPRLVKTGVAGPDAAVLAVEPCTGRPLRDLEPDEVTDEVLAATWEETSRLHGAGIAHGNLDASGIFVADDGVVTLGGLHAADLSGRAYWRDRDDATILVSTALLVGKDRAVKAAIAACGAEHMAAVLPMIQRAALPTATQRALKKHGHKFVSELQTELAHAAGIDEVKLFKIRRLSLTDVGMLAGVLVAIAIAIPTLTSFSGLGTSFQSAKWGWVVLAALVYPLILMAWGGALTGAVNVELPYLPTVAIQLAATTLNLITPNGIGGTALQIDYVHKKGAPVASSTTAVLLVIAVGSFLQFIMLVLGIAITGATLSTSKSNSGGIGLGAIALVAAGVGVVLLVPKIRGKVVRAVKQALHDLWAVLRNPHKALRLVGGDLAGDLLFPAVLGLCLLAFGHSLNFAQLIVVQVGAGMLGQAAPVPGGIGVTEAALTSGLALFGVPATPALAAVLTYRAITFVIPSILGWFTLKWLRRRGDA